MSNKHFPTSYESKFWNWYFIIPPYLGGEIKLGLLQDIGARVGLEGWTSGQLGIIPPCCCYWASSQVCCFYYRGVSSQTNYCKLSIEKQRADTNFVAGRKLHLWKMAHRAIFPVTFCYACSSLWLFVQLRYTYILCTICLTIAFWQASLSSSSSSAWLPPL